MKDVVRYNPGTNRVLDAVELKSGILIVEYRFTHKFKTGKGYLYQDILVIFAWYGRAPLTHVLARGYVDELPTGGKRG